jgi:hypothetical protein
LRQTYQYEPFVLTTSPSDRELTDGLVLCRINSRLTGKRLVSLPFSDHCEPLVDRQEDLEALLGSLEGELGKEDLRYIEIRPLGLQLPARSASVRPIGFGSIG